GGQQDTRDVPVEMPDGVRHEGVFGGAAARPNSSANYSMSSNGRLASRAGDPLIAVSASKNARRVVAIMPDGVVKDLKWNAVTARWEARFDIPTYAGEGEYRVTVIIAEENGVRRRLGLSYRVDSSAPLGAARFAPEKDGTLRLEIEASADTERVAALLPWGEKAALTIGPNGRFATRVAAPVNYRGNLSTVTFVLTDKAHNRTTLTLDLSQ
ncbi:MAG TPA: hypothetical protein VF719_10230, partial [Abditibacteriaceae bacterium]